MQNLLRLIRNDLEALYCIFAELIFKQKSER